MEQEQQVPNFYGILLLPDAETANKAQTLGQRENRFADMIVKPSGAHMTLYQCRRLKTVDQVILNQMLEVISDLMKGHEIMLDQVTHFEADPAFLFWNAQLSPKDEKLHNAHKITFAFHQEREVSKEDEERKNS